MNKEGKVTLGLIGTLGAAMVLGSARAEMCESDAERLSVENQIHATMLNEQEATRAEIEAILEDGPEGIDCEDLPNQAMAAPGFLCESDSLDPNQRFIVSFPDHEKTFN